MPLLNKSVVGVEFHDHLVQFVELKQTSSNVSLEAFNRISLPAGTIEFGEVKKPQDLLKILGDLFSRANPRPANLKRVAVILPSKITFTHIFKFPSSFSLQDIHKAIPYQAETIIPFGINDVYWDFSILERENPAENKKASQSVLFGAVTKKDADQYAQLLESLHVTPFLFGINVEALRHALVRQLNPKGLNLIIDLGAVATDFLILEGRTVKYFFSDNSGVDVLLSQIGQTKTLSEPDFYKKWEQAKADPDCVPIIQAFIEKQYKKGNAMVADFVKQSKAGSVSSVYFTGEFSNLPNFYNLVSALEPKHNIYVGDPKKNLLIQDSKFQSFQKEQKDGAPYSVYFTSVIGVALEGLSGSMNKVINLLPDSLKKGFASKRTAFIMGLISLAMTFFSLGVAGFLIYLQIDLNFERALLEGKKASIQQTIYGTRYQSIKDSLLEFNEEVAILGAIDSGLFSVPTALESIRAEFPKGIRLTTMNYLDKDLTLTLTGVADTRETLLQLQENMQTLSLIDHVDLPFSNFDEKVQISFMMTLTLDFSHLPPYAEDTTP